MRLRPTFAVLVPLVVAGSLVIAALRLSPSSLSGRRTPRLVADRLVDLGARQQGAVQGYVTLFNQGEDELLIHSVRTSCGCLSVFRCEDNGSRGTFSSARLAPGESVNIGVEFVAVGNFGTLLQHSIQLHTNDPFSPDEAITFQVCLPAPVAALPSSVVFPPLSVGRHSIATVEVWGDSQQIPVLDQPESTNPNCISVRLVPTTSSVNTKSGVERAGQLLGVIEVSTVGERTGEFHGAVMVRAKGRPSPVLSVPVSGEFRAAVEIAPSQITLPRQSGTGPIYTATCLVRSNSGNALTVQPGTCPDGITCSVNGGAQSSVVALTISCDVNRVGPLSREERLTIPIRVSDGGSDRELALSVVIRPAG